MSVCTEKLTDITWLLQKVKKELEIYLLCVPNIFMEGWVSKEGQPTSTLVTVQSKLFP